MERFSFYSSSLNGFMMVLSSGLYCIPIYSGASRLQKFGFPDEGLCRGRLCRITHRSITAQAIP